MEIGTFNTIEVDSVDDFTAKIESNGGTVLRPISAIRGVGWIAYCQDTKGNTFSIMKSDRDAQ